MRHTQITLSKGFQITLPSAFRKLVGLEVGDPIDYAIEDNHLVLSKGQTLEEQLEEMDREIKRINEESDKHLTPEQREFNQKTAGWTINQFHEYFDNLPETKAYIKEKYDV